MPDDGSRARGPRETWLPWPARALRERLRWMAVVLDSTHEQVGASREEMGGYHDDLARRIGGVANEQERLLAAVRVIADREPWQRERLRDLRLTADYQRAFEEDEPLVSVVIPTYDNHELLGDRALPSVLAQTYENLEVIVVGDGAPAQAREAVEAIGDERLRFHNLAPRGPYPDDPETRWLVAGVPPFNEAVRLARGRWIAPLDDDDAFRPGHVERLLAHAHAERAELAYGAMRQHRPGGVSERVGGFPPRLGQFNIQSAIYHAGLAPIFELELADEVFRIPYDWSLCRRMMRAGVRVAMLDEEVVDYYPSRYWAPRAEPDAGSDVSSAPGPKPAPPGRPAAGAPQAEWEVAEEGFEVARGEERQAGRGWDVEAVAEAYRRKWPSFLEAIEGPGPLGVPHEVPEHVAIPRDDPLAHNIVFAYGHALAMASRSSESISVLDWGGALGHYRELGRRLLEDVELDYHCRELPAVCAVGRSLAPDLTFHEDDSCLERGYDLVLASGSLQYEQDWRGRLAELAAAARPWLFVTRMPVVETCPTFAARQRAYGYGYETEYVGWVLHRGELLAAGEAAGLELVREYALVGPMPVAGAPESPRHIGLLWRAPAPGP